ncbi:MAG: helix-turn-helix transcriptional regulator [Pseudomonadota bacterium]
MEPEVTSQANSSRYTQVSTSPTDEVGRLLRIGEVCKEVGLCKAMIYRCMRLETAPFPRPVKIGHASRWREMDIRRWKLELATQAARQRY